MIRKLRKICPARLLFALSFQLILLTPSLAFAGDPQADFEKLKIVETDYQVTGAVCEQVAKLRFELQYPAPMFEVVTGIAYGNSERTIGELDVIVFRNDDREAVLIAEVKCWKDLRGARAKAMDQRQRFQNTISAKDASRRIEMAATSKAKTRYQVEQFDSNPRFIAVAQAGARNAGFEMELDYTLEELMFLRKKLMDCHDRNHCTW